MRPVFVGMAGAHVAGAVEQLERALVPAAGPRPPVQPRHGFGVVVQHVGLRVDDGPQRRFAPPGSPGSAPRRGTPAAAP